MSNKRDITIDDLFRIKFLNSSEISPDGTKIVFTYKWTDLKASCYYSNLYMADTRQGSVAQFTRGDHHDTGPQWSPNGKYILFRSDREKKNGLWLIATQGGEAYPLMTDKGGVAEYIWAPDSKHVAYTFRQSDAPVPVAHMSNDPAYVRKEEDENPYDIIEEMPYKTKGGQITAKGKFHIYLLDIETGTKTQLTDANYHDGSLAFSPDGKRLAFCSNRVSDPLHDWETTEIYVLELETKKLEKITNQWGPKSGLGFSADGQFIYFTGHHAQKGEEGPEDLKIYKVPAQGGQTILLTQNFTGFVSNMLIGDTREFDDITQPPALVDDHKNFLCCASYHGGCYLYQVSTDGGQPKRIEEGDHEVVYYSIDQQGQNMAVLKGDILSPPELYHYQKMASGWQSKKLTSFNAFLQEETTISRPEDIWFTTSEGIALQGWLLKPPQFDANNKYPLIHQIHGGPHILYGYTFFHEMQLMAATGYCVLFINPRGSRGYGTAFCRPIEGNWGVPDYRDQMAFLDHVISRPYIDKENLFLTGGSYGGYMTNWVVTQTDRYRAAASHRSICNMISAFGVSSGCFHFEHSFGGVPWKDFEHYRQHSPLFFASNVKTPILLMQSELDHLTPTGEAEQFFVALRYLNKEVRLVRFKNESHGLSREGKPTNRRARLEIVLAWFESHRKSTPAKP